jgi:multiple sugar transport system ATP-binding protein
MSSIRLEQVTKRFGNHAALSDVSFSVGHQEFFVLLGPTGAGKTTTLRVVAGLEKQDEGHVYFDDALMDSATPAERDVAFVFQQYSLYPNKTVYENLAFPLRSPLRQVAENDIKERVTSVAEKLRITHLLQRRTTQLSGGEMQRVSIGRAIVREPRVFLMDEPLSNLDAKLREALRVELKHLQKTQNSTTIFVTHDQIEALTMADRIAVLDHGRIVQVGTPHDIYDRPATTFVAQLVGTPRINILPATRENGNLVLERSELHLPAPGNVPQNLLLGIRPEDIKLSADGQYAGEVSLLEPLGVETIIHIKSGEQTLLSIVPGAAQTRIGDHVRFNIVRERLHFFSLDGVRV